MGKHNGLAAGSFLRVKASANSAAVFSFRVAPGPPFPSKNWPWWSKWRGELNFRPEHPAEFCS